VWWRRCDRCGITWCNVCVFFPLSPHYVLRVLPLLSQSVVLGFMWWSIWAILFAVIAVSAGHFITPLAVGSGIPEMKSILSGTPTLAQ